MVTRIHRRCAHCRRKAAHSWTLRACALNRKRVKVWLCSQCDIAIQRLVLNFISYPKRAQIMRRYVASLQFA